MARAITDYEELLIVTPEPERVQELLEDEIPLERVHLIKCDTNDTWARDHGFLTLSDGTCLDFCFNGWGEKFEATLDNDINRQLYPFLQLHYREKGITTDYKMYVFGKIAKWFSDLKALAFKDTVSDSDISGTISDSHIASASTWNSKASGTHTHNVTINGVSKTIPAPGEQAVELMDEMTTTEVQDILDACT